MIVFVGETTCSGLCRSPAYCFIRNAGESLRHARWPARLIAAKLRLPATSNATVSSHRGTVNSSFAPFCSFNLTKANCPQFRQQVANIIQNLPCVKLSNGRSSHPSSTQAELSCSSASRNQAPNSVLLSDLRSSSL